MNDQQRELLWCLCGPDLLAPHPVPLAELDEWLQRCPAEAIAGHFASLPQRIGRRFERHWSWAMAQLPGWTVHAADRQIQIAGRTLGAPDLLLSGKGETWHIELAVKFYLCHPARDGLQASDWLGPGTNDRLDRKLHRVHTHQLHLLQRPDVQQWLREQRLPLPTRYAAILKGVLFQNWKQPQRTPGEIQPAGRWCHLDDLPEALTSAQLLRRGQWLGGHGDCRLLSEQSLYSAVAEHLQHTGSAQLSSQNVRWFVVPNQWP